MALLGGEGWLQPPMQQELQGPWAGQCCNWLVLVWFFLSFIFISKYKIFWKKMHLL